jgi:hypothetical protein
MELIVPIAIGALLWGGLLYQVANHWIRGDR